MRTRSVTAKLFLILLIIWLLPMANLFAGDTGKIAGRVIDKETREPLIGANVTISASWEEDEEVPMDTPMGAATDEDGFFFILNVQPGLYTLNTFYLGYTEMKKIKVEVFVDKTTQVDFSMSAQVLQGEEVTVEAYSTPKIEVDRTATKQVYQVNAVENIAGVSNIADIIGLQADVIDDHFRGGREGESLYLLGGATINNPLNNSRAFEPIVTGLQQVEVFTSGFSAEYGNAQSGVVNMVPKEGGDKWATRLEFSLDLPHYQTWGGDPFSTSYMPFWDKLNNPAEWLGTQDSALADAGSLFDLNGYDFWPKGYEPTHEDSLRIAKFARADFVQAVRDMGLEYKNRVDTRFDISTGGPIAKNFKIFIAARQSNNMPVVPTPRSDRKRQWMSNLTSQLGKNDKVTLSFAYNDRFQNDVDNDYQSWFDRIFQVPKVTTNSQQYGLNWNHVFNHATFMNANMMVLNTDEETRPEYIDPTRYRTDMGNGESGSDIQVVYTGRFRHLPNDDAFNNVQLNRGYEKTKTYSFNSDLTSQVNRGNMVKTGVQFRYYNINVNSQTNFKSPTEMRYQDFSANPYEGAIYLQDKMEFEGMIANFGLRYDFYNFNVEYFSDLFHPLNNPLFSQGIGDATDARYALKAKTKFVGNLVPRLGISFPLSASSVFHINYGTFIQRPGFNRILYYEWQTQPSAADKLRKVGNPELKPERTSAYDVGIVQGLPGGITMDVSAYYKDVKDLIQEQTYVSIGGEQVVRYGNLDYANIKGFHFSLEKEGSFFSSYLQYNYQVASGKAPGPGSSFRQIYVYEDPYKTFQRERKDMLMDFDRTHRFIANVRFGTSPKGGPKIAGIRPLANLSLSTTLTYQSGTPYTDDEELIGLIYNKRTPGETDLRMRLQKSFKFGGMGYMLYLEGFNLLNLKTWDRDVFTTNDNLNRWRSGAREGEFIWYDPRYDTSDDAESAYMRTLYQTSLEQNVFSNKPRYFRAGVQLKF